MPSIADLIVNLTAETAAFTSKLDAAHKDAKKFAANIESEWNSLKTVGEALVAVLAVDKFADAIKGVAEQAKQMDKLSQSYGLAIETVSGLRVASKLTGVDMESLTVGMSRLAKNAADVAATGNATGGVFKMLGINVADANGHLRPMNDLLLDVAGRFAKMEDGTAKTALAIQAFGRSGAAMIPFLDRGKQGIQELMKLSEELGLTWTDKDLKAAQQFKEQLELLQLKSTALTEQFAQGMFPALNSLATAFLKSNAAGNSFAKTLGENLGSNVNTAAVGLMELGLAIKLFWQQTTGASQAEIDQTINAFTKLQKGWEDFQTGISTAPLSSHKGTGPAPAFGADQLKQLGDDMGAVAELAKKALDEGVLPLEKKLADLNFAITVFQDFAAQHPGTFFPTLAQQIIEVQKQMVAAHELAAQFAGGIIPGLAPGNTEFLSGIPNIADQMQKQIADLGAVITKAIETERAQEQALTAEAEASGLYRVQLEQQLINLRQQSAASLGPMVEQYRQLAAAISDPKLVESAAKFGAQLQTISSKGITQFRLLSNEIRDQGENAFVGFITGAESAAQAFNRLATAVLGDLGKMIYETIIWKTILSGLQSALPNFFGPSISGVANYSDLYQGGMSPILTAGLPGLAGGGDVMAGQTYIVGEHGPEPFVPGMSGTVLPHSAMRSGSDTPGNVQVNVVNQGSPKDAQVSQARYDRQMRQFVIDVVLTDVRTNGPLRGLIGS